MSFSSSSSGPQENGHAPLTIHFLGNILTFRARYADTKENFTVIEMITAPGAGSPPHTQTDQEAFLVLEGLYEITVGGNVKQCRSGDFVHVAPGELHMFRNIAEQPSKMLLINFPGDLHENFFRAVGEQLPFGTTEFPVASPPDIPTIVEAGLRFGIVIPPPPGP